MMKKFVGVKDLRELIIAYGQPQIGLKRDALIFEEIAIAHLSHGMSLLSELITESDRHILHELEWLYERGIIFDVDNVYDEGLFTSNKDYKLSVLASNKYGEDSVKYIRLSEKRKRNKEQYAAQGLMNYALSSQYLCRLISIALRERKEFDAYPALSHSFELSQLLHSKKRDVIQIVLNALPVPHESTSWEQLIEYRSDPDSIAKFLALRNWMSEMARAELTYTEIEEKLEWLLHDYQRHLELHRLKTNFGTLETVIVSVAEFLEDIANKKFSKIAKGLFKVKQRRIALLEAELKAPGKEVAYIQKTEEAFSKGRG